MYNLESVTKVHLMLHACALDDSALAPVAPGLASMCCRVPPALQQRWQPLHVQHQHGVLHCDGAEVLRMPLFTFLCEAAVQYPSAKRPTSAAVVQACT